MTGTHKDISIPRSDKYLRLTPTNFNQFLPIVGRKDISIPRSDKDLRESKSKSSSFLAASDFLLLSVGTCVIKSIKSVLRMVQHSQFCGFRENSFCCN